MCEPHPLPIIYFSRHTKNPFFSFGKKLFYHFCFWSLRSLSFAIEAREIYSSSGGSFFSIIVV
ncbi:hypothetical protein IscW_ISCW002355 [Ixodes scapularis]|uniref:Uncharacterized protein n=1 Tax=Ixodes scapularis TaxID=6945 RepID=B7PBC5_IXOSC|nr:hypothetical protein IscW_ISCW002355 [Ixodes scapularis]|eukprot:XP_002407942.1 hypothetical protein IscW_ISCW002355 [Ixodes scapularis]